MTIIENDVASLVAALREAAEHTDQLRQERAGARVVLDQLDRAISAAQEIEDQITNQLFTAVTGRKAVM